MVCVPEPLNATFDKAATPNTRLTGKPPFRFVVVEPTVSVKVTVPAGVVPLLVVSVTVAVIVTDWAAVTAPGLTATTIEVASAGAVTPVPDSPMD
jgi:hypothetical protein